MLINILINYFLLINYLILFITNYVYRVSRVKTNTQKTTQLSAKRKDNNLSLKFSDIYNPNYLKNVASCSIRRNTIIRYNYKTDNDNRCQSDGSNGVYDKRG